MNYPIQFDNIRNKLQNLPSYLHTNAKETWQNIRNLPTTQKVVLGGVLFLFVSVAATAQVYYSKPSNSEVLAVRSKISPTKKPTPTKTVSPIPSLSPTITLTPTSTPTPTVTVAPTPDIKTWYVSPNGSDSASGDSQNSPFKTIQKALDTAQGGSRVLLGPGVYMQDAVSKQAGVTIEGSKDAIVKGAGGARVIEIRHDNVVLSGFTIDGKHDDGNSKESYRDKLIYVQGSAPKDGISGLKILNMTITNAGGECIRLRYFVTGAEVAYNSITNCGRHDYAFGDGGKNGEGIYIGTAPEQRGDGKNPTSDPDESNSNQIHHNTINTQGNECVDIKEDSKNNIVENNSCTGQKDPNSGGMDSRGGFNVFRNNEIFDNSGAGVRLGGDTVDQNINNDVYDNTIRGNKSGGIKFQTSPQGKICGNKMEKNDGGNAVGSKGKEFDPVKSC